METHAGAREARGGRDARPRRARATLALVAALLVAASCAGPPTEGDPGAPDAPPAADARAGDGAPVPAAPRDDAPSGPAGAAPDADEPQPRPDEPRADEPPDAAPPPDDAPPVARERTRGWMLEPDALLARGAADRAAAIGSRVAALEDLAVEVRQAAATARTRAAGRDDLHAALDDLARLVEATRGVLGGLAAQTRTLADGLARVDRDERAARARRDAAAAQRLVPSTQPLYPDLPLEQARVAIERDVRRLADERARLAEAVAAALDEPQAAAEPPLVAREAERLLQVVPRAIGDADLARDELADVVRVAHGLAITARAAAAEATRVREGLRDLARRERDVARLVEEAASFELERRRVRLDEVNRQVLDRERRQEETERLARREQELDGQITRLQQALAQAEARARQEDAAVAAVRSRTQAIAPSDDPTLRSYQTTLDDHHRRLDLARKRRDAARADLEALQANLTGERDSRAALVLALRDRIEAAHQAWEDHRDPRPLEVLERTLAEAGREAEEQARDLAAAGAEAGRLADEALSLAELSAREGERRALYLPSAPESHKVILTAIEEVRALLESTRREESRHRRAQARALDDARSRAEQDVSALRQDLAEVTAARRASQEARRLNTGALRASLGELRALAAAVHSDAAARVAGLEAAPPEVRWRAGSRLGTAAAAAALVLAAGLYLRRRARARVEALLTTVDPERRIILDPIDRWTFYGAYLLRGGLPWAALAVVPWAVAVPLELPAAGAARVSGALTALLGVQVVGLFNHILLRDRLVRAVLPLSEENKRPLHRRIQLALAAFGPLLVAWLLARGVPELWATATVLRASLSVLLVLALIATLHVARHDVGDHLRFEVTPPEPGGRLPVFDLLKTLYNRVVDELLTLVLLDLLVIGTLWVGGYVEQAAFLLRATVQTALTLGAALLLVALARKANRRVMSGSLANETTRPGVQITLSMLAFVGSRLAEVLILAAVGVSLFDAWGGDVEPVLAFLRSDRFVHGVAAVLKVLFACAAAFYANRLANFTVDAFVEQTLRTASPDVARRRDTFAPLAKSAIRYVLIMAALVYSATQAGLDIVSILAGLGVLGLAIAFGAQTLVKDVISGVFVIIDDELAVGDWVRIRDVEGTVEHVGVRTTKVRTVTGVLISVPNGSIDQVHNFNRGWNRAIVEVNVTYDAPVEKAMAVLKEVAEEYRRQRPDLLIEAPEVQGITQYGTSGITLRVRVKTAPLALWQVERELRLRALVAFEDQGIEIPISRHVVFLKTDDGDGRGLQPADVVRQLAAAAAAHAPPLEPAPAREPLVAEVVRSAPAPEAVAAPPPAPAVVAPAPVVTPAVTPTPTAPEPAATPAATPAADEPAPPEPPAEARPPARTRRLVLSDEARARLQDEAYVRAVTAEEPAIPAEMQAAMEAIERQRQETEAARLAALEPAPGPDPEGGDEAAAADGADAPPADHGADAPVADHGADAPVADADVPPATREADEPPAAADPGPPREAAATDAPAPATDDAPGATDATATDPGRGRPPPTPIA